jgi:hypothetical protein
VGRLCADDWFIWALTSLAQAVEGGCLVHVVLIMRSSLVALFQILWRDQAGHGGFGKGLQRGGPGQPAGAGHHRQVSGRGRWAAL